MLIDDIVFQKKQMHSGRWGSQERQSVCYIYDMIIFPVGFSFVLSPFQYHNALQKAQMRYRLLHYFTLKPLLKTSTKTSKIFFQVMATRRQSQHAVDALSLYTHSLVSQSLSACTASQES